MTSRITPPKAQLRLVEALLDPARYPHQVQRVECIETHISWVLLAGDYAYKVKKGVDLGFLDFTTLSLRRHFCQEELRLNRRLAPRLYLDVWSIGGSPEAPLWQEEPAIEYAVRMRRFPPEARLDHVLERGELQPHHLTLFADRMARFHDRADRPPPASPWGGEDVVWQAIEENFAPIAEAPGERGERLAALEERVGRLFERQRERIRRRRQGRIRCCHGDLHLQNLVLLEGEVVPFDGIEFNPAFYWIDPINDIAFLFMDLNVRGEPALAWVFLNGWLTASGDYEGLPLLPLYATYRALVRAKVSAIRLVQAAAERETREAVERYLGEAQRLLAPPPPILVLMHGLSGSGKSVVAGHLTPQLEAVWLRSDVERKRLHPQQQGRYAPETSDRVFDHLRKIARLALESGFNVVVDATFLERKRRKPFLQLAGELDIPLVILHVEAPPEVLRRRVTERARCATDPSEADLRVLEQQLAGRGDPLDEEERGLALSLDTENTSPEELAKEALAACRTFRLLSVEYT
ncbi:MAG TPA: hypothetical protein ENK54_00455 [Thiotrichales bacterium]|nr:hypothetical protein [Thiotrichales bacterium]